MFDTQLHHVAATDGQVDRCSGTTHSDDSLLTETLQPTVGCQSITWSPTRRPYITGEVIHKQPDIIDPSPHQMKHVRRPGISADYAPSRRTTDRCVH